jgi:RHS repeat-associated protein
MIRVVHFYLLIVVYCAPTRTGDHLTYTTTNFVFTQISRYGIGADTGTSTGSVREPRLMPVQYERKARPPFYHGGNAQKKVKAENTLPTTDPNYQTIFSNYMNQQWGFSLTYADYAAYDASHPGLLCNTMPYTTIAADPNDCIKNAIAKAVIDGLADYNAYIANQRQLFKASYIGTCRLAQANANLNGLQQQYHYTLYYYDQADNLSRTIPPEGVTLFDASQFGYIDRARDNDTAAYAYTYNGPTTASSLTTALTTLSATLSASVGSVEMWLYNNSTSNYHWVEATPDRSYLFQVGLSGNKLAIDVYPMVQPTGASIQLVPATGHYQADITALLPLPPFAHVVFQGNTLGAGTSLPQLYLNGTQLTVSNTSAPSPFGFNITAGATSVIFPDSIYSLKHLRLYTHLLTQATITADANNAFFNAIDLTYTGWYRFNVPAPGTPPTTINANTSDETNIIDTYPAHVLPTTYAYNSTNQVTQQNSPDGGTNSFWYDLLSRLVVSQNDKQLAGSNYSYTQYDVLGRITEVGQKNETTVSIGAPDYLTSAALTSFAAAGTNSQITDTYYDKPVPTVSGHTNGIATLPGQSYLRKRVAASTYTETQGSPVLRATYYNYDLDGNVKTLWQQVDGLYINSSNAGLKRIDYEYDLVSGKVNFVRYQDGQPDAFYYSYRYDADNRIVKAYSSVTAMVDTALGSFLPASIRKLDAIYYYYLHGPLRRQVIGGDSAGVQGIDYAYTLQGWLKGVNSTAATAAADMGQDGADLSHKVARDAYGYNLYYFNTDYSPIITTNLPFATTLQTGGYLRQLYNGNIVAASVNIPQLTSSAYWLDKVYTYDQLNRIKSATAYHTAGMISTPVHNGDYDEQFTYDGNGNILTVNRAGSGTGTLKDIESYNYNRHSNGQLVNNQLNYLNGHAGASNITPDQSINNYTYDPIGNLTADVQAGITAIGWNVYGKITNINKASGNITYTYNPAGQRVSKTVLGVTTYYIRDAQGNPLALYDNKSSNVNWREQHLYGSSRLGMWTPNVNLSSGNALGVWDTIGRKQYELTNHLGNVLATLADKRLQHTTSGTSIDYYLADIATAQDYYSFGSLQPGRQYSFNNVYRYGFNGKENDNEIRGIGNQQDYGQRININWIGRFSSVDPIGRQYPELSSYQFAGNNPILNIDLDGLEPKRLHSDDPITEFFNDIAYKFELKVYKFEAKVSKMSDQQIQDGINKTAASIIRNPVKVIDNAIKDIEKQGHQVPKDLKTFSHLVANGETKNARDFAENKIVEYAPWALFI